MQKRPVLNSWFWSWPNLKMHYWHKFCKIWISPWIRCLQYQKVDKKTFLSLATLTPNNKRFLFGGHFFRWESDTSTGDNLQIIGKVRKFLKKSTCIRKLENLKLQQKVQSEQLLTWQITTDFTCTRIDRYWLILVALPLRHLLLVIWRIKAVPLRL